MEKISVIVPAYNNAEYLPKCLESLMNQTYPALEILVVDDGSVDDTPEVLRKLSQRDDRTRVIRKENGGVTSARLLGVAESTGTWITFVDSDDWIEPDMYERLMKNAMQYGADISHCGHQMVYPNGRVDYYYNSGILRQQDRVMGLRDLLEEKLVEPGLCNKLYRRELFAQLADRMDIRIRNNEDMLMNYYLFCAAEKSVFEDVCPYHYMLRDGSASRRKMNEYTIYDPIRVRETILRECAPEIREDAQRALAETCLFIYAQLTRDMGKEYDPDRKRVREIVRKLRSFLPVLPMRNKLLVYVVGYAPWVFHLVYGVYYHFLKRK